jgi:hypothetical protein
MFIGSATNDSGAVMKRERLEAWLRNIYRTQEVEISCTQCFDLISGFVEVKLSGVDVAAGWSHIQQHLDQCRACRDEYESLLELRYMEEKSGLPSLLDLQGFSG